MVNGIIINIIANVILTINSTIWTTFCVRIWISVSLWYWQSVPVLKGSAGGSGASATRYRIKVKVKVIRMAASMGTSVGTSGRNERMFLFTGSPATNFSWPGTIARGELSSYVAHGYLFRTLV